jgi:hypothetical protein
VLLDRPYDLLFAVSLLHAETSLMNYYLEISPSPWFCFWGIGQA